MKKISLLFIVTMLFTGIVLNSCKKKDDATEEEITMTEGWNPTSVVVPSTAGTYVATLNLVGDWSAFQNTGSSWCSISQMSGSGQTEITITYKENLGAGRTAEAIAFNSAGTMFTIKVIQDASPYLCSGKPGVNSYFPLAMGNKWLYDFHGTLLTWEVTSTQTTGGFTYYIITRQQISGSSTLKLRVAANGDVYQNTASGDMLLVPGNTIAGADIGPDPSLTGLIPHRIVNSTNWTLSPPNLCTWDDVLYIEKIGQTGGVVSRIYFKKGLGMVADIDFDLKGVKLN
ncbi:MAG: BACON domain-containing protein [Bacteroidetes bacterium]|nr:BACON domain-containing protein [Bacteroidota bacterium]